MTLDEDDHNRELRVEHARPFDMLLDPGVLADATAWAGGGTLTAHEAQTPPNDRSGESLNLERRVERTGLEPATPCLQSRCSTN